MEFLQQCILERISKVPYEVLLMSKKNCHQKGLDSVVLGNNDGRLTRLFLSHEHSQNRRQNNSSNKSSDVSAKCNAPIIA